MASPRDGFIERPVKPDTTANRLRETAKNGKAIYVRYNAANSYNNLLRAEGLRVRSVKNGHGYIAWAERTKAKR